MPAWRLLPLTWSGLRLSWDGSPPWPNASQTMSSTSPAPNRRPVWAAGPSPLWEEGWAREMRNEWGDTTLILLGVKGPEP